jgi:DNA-binding transcriptional MerR regulator
MSDTILSIQDLSDQTGLPRRTIHFYIQQELLPPAQGSGLGAFYQREHLVRLKLIPILRQQGLRLDDIRQKFNALSAAELEDLLAKSENSPHPPLPAPGVPPPGTVAAPYQAYTLPYGLILLAPQALPAEVQIRFEKLVKTIQREFQS